jgi:hypothetical protein
VRPERETVSSSPLELAARAVAAPPRAAPDPIAELKHLGELRDAGVLTDAEFATEKARVLERM